jgi:CubicO group peptidase (beta-lactamase class C family)
MQQKVFAPLGMARTTLRPTVAMTYPLAQGHSNSGEVLRPAADNAATWPAGSVFSNVQDLSRFVIAVLNGGQLEGKRALPAAVVSRITTGYVETPGRDRAIYGYGLGIGTLRGARVLAHGGARSGYGSLIYMLPDQKIGVIVLANRNGASLSRTGMRALELMTALAPEASEPAPTPMTMTAAEMAEYVGAYSQTSKPEFEVFVKDGALFSKIDGVSLAVTKLDARRLAVTPPGAAAPVEFFVTRGKDGSTLYLSRGARALRKIGAPTT